MVEDHGVDELIHQWTVERSQDVEVTEATKLASAWLAESSVGTMPGIPGQRGRAGTGGLLSVESADPAYVAAMRGRLPGVPEDLLASAATCWQLVGSIADAEKWWDAGLSPLDQRALDYRAAGLSPADLSRHLGPYTVLEHLRRGSSPAWCVARLRRQRRDGVA
ncbi:MAG TPA: helix-turn-helix transcriptional regulator [Pseudonocardiaceae bacterium]|nr:helix-turn-helix transcriptional regulator [Pseudonocardiaceae bacterium]